VKIFKRLLENILFGKELKRFNDEILNEILNDIRQGKQVDAKLSYSIGKYIELHEINEKIFFEIRGGFLSGKISGAQVTIGAIN